MENRNCRKSEVKVRKMTDEQLCQYIDILKENAYKDGLEAGKKQGKPIAGNIIEKLIQHLDIMSGTGNGIGKSTVYKLRKFAEKEGYLGEKVN